MLAISGKMAKISPSLLLVISICLVQCKQPILSDLSLDFKRSILDQKPRMLSIWHGQFHIAYDLQRCNIYKIWTGGIHWDGATFNDIKTVQPGSWGSKVEMDTSGWGIPDCNDLAVNYKGYEVKEAEIRIRYELLSEDLHSSLMVDETVAISEGDSGVFFAEISFSWDPASDMVVMRNGTPITESRRIRFPEEVENPPFSPALGSGGQYWLDRSGCNTCHELNQNTTGPAYSKIAARYQATRENISMLVSRVQEGSVGQWGTTPMTPHPQLSERDIQGMVRYILDLKPVEDPSQAQAVASTTTLPEAKEPGFGAALEGVHPSFTLSTVRPAEFKPRVGGLDFDQNGNLYVATWDSEGAVYKLSGLEYNDSSKVEVTKIATGLSEPLGLKIVEKKIYVVQKNELTQLVDDDGDEIIDFYRNVCDDFQVSPDFHEYTYGLEYKDSHFYLTLGLAMRLMAHELQLPDRGAAIMVNTDGDYQIFATGLRQPNGIGLINDNLFVTENQGQWVPACKLICLREDAFYGCQYGTGKRYAGYTTTPPVVWLPQDEIGNSPSQPVEILEGPFAGQIFVGEVTHGGIKRVFVEEVNGLMQGSVFRFTQGLEAGINRLVWGPDKSLYVGGIGMNGNWAWQGRQYGLQKLTYNGKITFEIKAIRLTSDGFEIEFTEPVHPELATDENMYQISHWTYETSAAYGSPKIDHRELTILAAEAKDPTKIFIKISDLKENYLVYFLLSPELKSVEDRTLWSGEAWYTINELPQNVNL